MLVAYLLAAAALPQCTASNSVRTTVQEMAKEPERWFDRCVKLEGYVNWYYFYADLAGKYRHRATDKDDRPNEGWLGLYFRDSEETKRPFGKAVVTGRVDDCERSYQAGVAKAEPGTIIMMTGYCHYEGGLTLKDATVGPRSPAKFDRARGDEARRKFGDLEVVLTPHGIPHSARELVAEFKSAFARKDSAELVELAEPYDVTIAGDPEKERQYVDILTGIAGPLSAFRQAGQLPDPSWFFTKLPKDADSKPDWYACFCRISDCSGEWPISTADAYLSNDLPYACLQAYEDNSRSGELALGVIVGAIIQDSDD